MPNEFWSLVYSHSSVFVAAAVQLINFPWDRRALDYSIPNECVWEGDIVFDDPIHQLSLYLDHCAEAYDLIMGTLIRHPKSRKLACFHRVERDIDPGEHSFAIAGITAPVDLFMEHRCGIVVECLQCSKFWHDNLAPLFIEKGVRALGYDWSNHCGSVASQGDQLDAFACRPSRSFCCRA